MNYATERASVRYAPDAPTTPEDVVAAVEQAGYDAILPATARAPTRRGPARPGRRRCAARLIFAAIAPLPLLALGMIPALQFDNWQWISLQLATPVLVWAALAVSPRGVDEPAPRHGDDGHADLDRNDRRLDVVGHLAAVPRRGRSGHAPRALSFVPERGGPAGDVYFEAVGVVITFLLAGRWFEARAKRSAGAALRALLALGAKEVSILDADGVEQPHPDRRS